MAKPTFTVELLKSQYDNLQPTISISWHGAFRQGAKITYDLAAFVEDETPTDDQWIVVARPHGMMVNLELMQASQEEAERGMETLRMAVARWKVSNR